MTGVEVLAQQEVAVEHAYCWPAFLITAGIIVVVFAVVGIVLSIREYDWMDLIACVLAGVFFGAVTGALLGTVFQTPTAYKTQYKVVISDEVPMNEFYERYEVISQEGKIYTIRER